MSPSRSLVVLACLVVPLLSSCRKATSPVAPDGFEGAWAGQVIDDTWGTGTATMATAPLPIGVTGTWSFRFDAAPAHSGSLNGSVTGSSVTLVMSPSTALSCGVYGSIGVTGTIEGRRLKGTYVRFTCAGLEGGSLDLTRTD